MTIDNEKSSKNRNSLQQAKTSLYPGHHIHHPILFITFSLETNTRNLLVALKNESNK